MKKLTLDLDQLRVETFDTRPERDYARATVRAYSGEPTACATENPEVCATYNLCTNSADVNCNDSTALEVLCTCTAGGPGNTCDPSYCGSCPHDGCETVPHCPTNPGYPGC